jgi:pilus assembly protein Flp/PilA
MLVLLEFFIERLHGRKKYLRRLFSLLPGINRWRGKLASVQTHGPNPSNELYRTLHSGLGDYIMTKFSRFLKDESGATAIEYGLIAALVGVGLITALTGLKDDLATLFGDIGTTLTGE